MITEAIVVALITGAFSVLGVYIANAKQQATIIEKIDQLEKKADRHNQLIERMYIVETKIDNIEKDRK